MPFAEDSARFRDDTGMDYEAIIEDTYHQIEELLNARAAAEQSDGPEFLVNGQRFRFADSPAY